MVTIGNKIVYRDEVCTISDLAKNFRNGEDYYTLTSSHDASLLIRIPVSGSSDTMRPLITKSEIAALIKKIPEIPVVPIDSWNRGLEYKELLTDGSHESIISIIKTSYIRQQTKVERHQKPNESDKVYFRRAERLFYSEIAAALDVSYEEAKEYIIKEVAAITLDDASQAL